MKFPPSVRLLIEEFKRLPGIGEKNARRLAFYLLSVPGDRSRALASALVAMKDKVRYCERCFSLTEDQLCDICRDPGRTAELLCVVQSPGDIMAIETTGQYRGRYHVLMGVLSPMRGIGPDDLRIGELVRRIEEEGIKEVIVATNLDVEGEATASYLVTTLRPQGVRVSRIARGIPIGGSLEHADSVTLGLAIDGRLEL
ncbi:MAG: recombination mediator RecR [bacterium]|nr:recombination mediator RecR [bacterium]MDT8396178.1 recombination mediator RecR [bacterium]